MLRSGDRVERGSTLRADVCIVGAGAASMSLVSLIMGTAADSASPSAERSAPYMAPKPVGGPTADENLPAAAITA